MNTIQRRALQRLAKLSEGATMCPGQLARDCRSELSKIRPDLVALASAGKIVLSQRGKAVKAESIKGPFRLRLA